MRDDDSGVGTAGSVGEVRLAGSTAELVGSLHHRASAAVLDAASTAPVAVDAGVAGPLLGRLLGGVAATADLLVDLNEVLAALVDGVERDLSVAEDAVVAAFGAVGGRLR